MVSTSSPSDVTKILQPLLASLLEMKSHPASAATEPVQEPMLVTPTTSVTQPVQEPVLVTSTTAMEDLTVVQTLWETFLETSDFDYLDNAIALTEEIISASSPPKWV